MSETELYSFAKINLGLEIIKKRADGFHELKTVFQTISLHDTLKVRENKKGKIVLTGDDKSVPWDEQNTIYRISELIYKNFNIKKGLDIYVKKKIPAGAGLGGGSSNAATVLIHLVERFGLKTSLKEMIEISKSVGADIPFFLIGGTVLGEGIGDKLTLLREFPEKKIALVFPGIFVSTGAVYSSLNLTKSTQKSKIELFLNSGNFSVLKNYLEEPALRLFPKLKRVKKMIKETGLDFVMMSGSGSSMFCFPKDRNIRDLKTVFNDVYIGKTINRNEYLNKIGASPSGKASVFGADIRRFESSRPRD